MSSTTPTPADAAAVAIGFREKWWTYQRERFPLVAHGALIGSFSFCAVSLSRMLRIAPGWPAWQQLVVAFGTCFAFFLQLRIADEFKDYEEDLRHRPYRPVQRGLISLRELGVLFILAAAAQLLLALWLRAALVTLLIVTWTYLAAMSKEFFVADWLRRRHVLYMVSHMAIMPLVDLYATSVDWLGLQAHPPRGLMWFLGASYFNGLVIEIGRKIRSPADEEVGVDTYSRLWGRVGASVAWCVAMTITAGLAMVVASNLRGSVWIYRVLLTGVAGGIAVCISFLRAPLPRRGKRIETYAGVWTLLLYLSLGLLPHVVARGAQ